ncbi:Uncharacterised protein [Delftia tsuruhatensis]|nr:Uncharacterised protein [Delftia tsuruhatensis]CAC9678082.1 Uncharacterised protein [Delftia tsuruhatensis]
MNYPPIFWRVVAVLYVLVTESVLVAAFFYVTERL